MRTFSRIALVIAFLLPVIAHANTLNYTFTYSGSSSQSTVTGNGALTYDTTTDTLTAFSFTDTIIDTDVPFTSTYTYGLGDVQFYLISPDATFTSISSMSLHTTTLTGTNSGPAAFLGLQYPGSHTQVVYKESGDFIMNNGSIVLTAVTSSPVPEPSSLALLSTCAFGLIATARRKFLRA